MLSPQYIGVDAVLDRYEALLLDAYGVLVTGGGALPGAAAFIARLEHTGHPYFIVTNDASRLPGTVAARFSRLGLSIPEERIVTSGSLIGPHFHSRGLSGMRCAVMGPTDSAAYVRLAGGEVVPVSEDFEVLVVCDERGTDFIADVNAALSSACRRIDRGDDVHLVLPNPDLIYPHGDGRYAFTAGTIALMLEEALAVRYPDRHDLRFERLGKPHTAIYEEGIRRAGTRTILMVGDQLATDIAGANAAGIDSALIAGGITGARLPENGPRPTWLLAAFGS
ncbi:MAG TPA: HAD hydrolase-like protein [Gammaproteobacteria bacterium]|nr:HAD hydrolase-like protein [Gammaproteobacteria bacterium]